MKRKIFYDLFINKDNAVHLSVVFDFIKNNVLENTYKEFLKAWDITKGIVSDMQPLKEFFNFPKDYSVFKGLNSNDNDAFKFFKEQLYDEANYKAINFLMPFYERYYTQQKTLENNAVEVVTETKTLNNGEVQTENKKLTQTVEYKEQTDNNSSEGLSDDFLCETKTLNETSINADNKIVYLTYEKELMTIFNYPVRKEAILNYGLRKLYRFFKSKGLLSDKNEALSTFNNKVYKICDVHLRTIQMS